MRVFDKPVPSILPRPLPMPLLHASPCINSVPPEAAPSVFKDNTAFRHSSIFRDGASGSFQRNLSVPILSKRWNVLVNAPSRANLGAGTATTNSIHAVSPPACGYQGTNSLQPNVAVRGCGTSVSSPVNSGSKRKQQDAQVGNSGGVTVSRNSDNVLDLPGNFLVLELCGGSARLTKAFFCWMRCLLYRLEEECI